MLGAIYECTRVPSRSRGKKVIDTREGALHFPRTNRRRVRRTHERIENKTHIDARRRDETTTTTTGHSTRRAFLSPGGANPGSPPSSSSSSFSLHHPPPRRRPSSSSYSASFFARPRRLHDEAEVEGRRTRAAVRERETIPVEEGPFCPAHPTRGFRRPWSH